MEVGIHKGRGEGPEGTLLIYDHLGEYTLSKKPGGIPAYTAQYTTVCKDVTTPIHILALFV